MFLRKTEAVIKPIHFLISREILVFVTVNRRKSLVVNTFSDGGISFCGLKIIGKRPPLRDFRISISLCANSVCTGCKAHVFPYCSFLWGSLSIFLRWNTSSSAKVMGIPLRAWTSCCLTLPPFQQPFRNSTIVKTTLGSTQRTMQGYSRTVQMHKAANEKKDQCVHFYWGGNHTEISVSLRFFHTPTRLPLQLSAMLGFCLWFSAIPSLQSQAALCL